MFVLVSSRPEARPPWRTLSHHGAISLAPLDRDQVRHMVGNLTAGHALPKEVIDGVTERVGGVPLFIEEVTRLLLDHDEQGGIQPIPPTLQQSLTARLDRLGAAREVAQIGAVIGRDFTYWLLRTVTGMEETPLQIALYRLAEADILLARGLPPESDYRFKHALIQTRPTKICSKVGARFCTAALPRRYATMRRPPRRPSRSCWRITLPRPV